MQPNPYGPYPYGPYPYGPYPYASGAQMPVRYMVPAGYRQNSPPFANQSFDRYAPMPAAVRVPPNMTQPIRYPPGYRPGYPPSGMPMSPASNMMPVGTSPRPRQQQQQQQQQQEQQQQHKQSEQIQPPQPYYYNPYGPNGNPTASPGPKVPPPKKGAKEYKDNAFTIAPDGAHSESIKGLVSNNDINDLLKHKGTKVKVSKIYRITKTKPDIVANDSSDEDLPLPIRQPPPPPPPPPQSAQRPISSSSSGSHCSTCSNCSCSECRGRRRSHVDDDCSDCRAERMREQERRQRRR